MFNFFEKDINKIAYQRSKGQTHLLITDKDGDTFQIDDHDIGTLIGEGIENVFFSIMLNRIRILQ